jgi:phage protein
MKIEELIKKYEYLNHDCFRRVDTSQVLRDLKQLDEPETGHADEAPRYVKNILARLRELPLHDREVWLKVIISEFKQDFSRAKWREGYEQGKIEGMVERDKVTIPQFVADWIKYCKNTNVTMTRALLVGEVDFYNYANQKDLSRLTDFFSDEKNQEIFARAWLDGYEVEEKKRYRVRFKGLDKDLEYLNFKHGHVWVFSDNIENEEYRTAHTRKELEEAGFGEVFNSTMFEVEEVTE